MINGRVWYKPGLYTLLRRCQAWGWGMLHMLLILCSIDLGTAWMRSAWSHLLSKHRVGRSVLILQEKALQSTSHPAGGGTLGILWNQTCLSTLGVDLLTAPVGACEKAAHKIHPAAPAVKPWWIYTTPALDPGSNSQWYCPWTTPNRHDRTSKGVCEILSRFSSKSSEHSLNATRSSCFSSVSKYPISLVKLTRKSHCRKELCAQSHILWLTKRLDSLRSYMSKYYSL